MKARVWSLYGLQWSVGLVVLWESWQTFHHAMAHLAGGDHSSGLAHVRLLLSAAEIVAAVLFLLPKTSRFGGYVLLVIFALAAVIHTLHGDFGGMEPLIVYAAAVFVVLTNTQGR
jgi:uncharacterized membrane protein YphA (DoxX/SURF4 family)